MATKDSGGAQEQEEDEDERQGDEEELPEAAPKRRRGGEEGGGSSEYLSSTPRVAQLPPKGQDSAKILNITPYPQTSERANRRGVPTSRVVSTGSLVPSV